MNNAKAQFVLTSKMKREGIILTVYFNGGMSQVTTWKDDKKIVEKVEKSAPSLHKISSLVIKNWLQNPASGYWKPGEWHQRSETARIQAHIEDFVHDLRSRGTVRYFAVEEQG
jgi:hypothetical protein